MGGAGIMQRGVAMLDHGGNITHTTASFKNDGSSPFLHHVLHTCCRCEDGGCVEGVVMVGLKVWICSDGEYERV